MVGIQNFIAHDLYRLLSDDPAFMNVQVAVSFFEIYGGRCQDLLNNRNKLCVREDGQGEVVVAELMELPVDSVMALEAVIDAGNKNRTTHATESNDESSRSHAICQITLYDTSAPPPKGSTSQYGAVLGRLSLIDLAGSERGADTKSNNRQRRMEGAEINKSLLALKECIRALDTQSGHVPYRGSKLTLCLKESFTRPDARTVMITTVSPVRDEIINIYIST
jgi:kinesin family member 2/24